MLLQLKAHQVAVALAQRLGSLLLTVTSSRDEGRAVFLGNLDERVQHL